MGWNGCKKWLKSGLLGAKVGPNASKTHFFTHFKNSFRQIHENPTFYPVLRGVEIFSNRALRQSPTQHNQNPTKFLPNFPLNFPARNQNKLTDELLQEQEEFFLRFLQREEEKDPHCGLAGKEDVCDKKLRRFAIAIFGAQAVRTD